MTETITQIKRDLADILEKVGDLVGNIEQHRDKDHECQRQTTEKLRDLFLVVVGHDGKNGLRSRLQALETKHEGVDPQEVKKAIDDLSRWKYQTMAIFAFIQIFAIPVIIAILLQLIRP
jgi:ABC-type transporter Mla subunit MlaD